MTRSPSGDGQALSAHGAPPRRRRARGLGRSDTAGAPFVGRDDELRLLKDLFHVTMRDSERGRVGARLAGIGKSRLAWEFHKYTDGLVEDVWWHAGRSPAYGEGLGVLALAEMVRVEVGCRLRD